MRVGRKWRGQDPGGNPPPTGRPEKAEDDGGTDEGPRNHPTRKSDLPRRKCHPRDGNLKTGRFLAFPPQGRGSRKGLSRKATPGGVETATRWKREVKGKMGKRFPDGRKPPSGRWEAVDREAPSPEAPFSGIHPKGWGGSPHVSETRNGAAKMSASQGAGVSVNAREFITGTVLGPSMR